MLALLVSVPLSGLASVNRIREIVQVSINGYVSVPLSGLASVNEYNLLFDSAIERFRPLIGVSFCKLNNYL